MNSALHPDQPAESPGPWRIVVDSIGDADASLLRALKRISPLPETRLAALLYQAPAILAGGLERESAEAINEMLQQAGLESRVIDGDTAFEPGDDGHELALEVGDFCRMGEVAELVVRVLGVAPPTAKKILCTSPTVLLGKVSAATAGALEQRFAALDVELIVSRAGEALFDVFLGDCSHGDRMRAVQALRGLGVEVADGDQPLLASGLARADADRIWERLERTSLPVRVINRDFERFDVRLDQAPASVEMIEFLTTSTGMPEAVAYKAVERTPLVTHPNVPFVEMGALLETIHQLGGEATADLLAFQSFALEITRAGDLPSSAKALEVLADCEAAEALAIVRERRQIAGPLTPPQARWLRWELTRAGTETRMVLR